MGRGRFSYAAFSASVLLVATPFLSFASVNFFDAGFDRKTFFTVAGLCILVLAVPLALLARRRDLKSTRIALALGLTWYAFFLFDDVSYALNLLSVVRIPPKAVFFTFLVAVGVSAYALARYEPARTAMLIFAVVLAGFPAANLAASVPPARSHDLALTPLALKERSGPPNLQNIYFVIADAYGSEDSLRRGPEFDNSDFLSSLRKRGYYVAGEAYSPYNLTYLTISAILNGDYIADSTNPTIHQNFYPVILKHERPPQAVRAFRDLGYQFYIVGNSWADCAGTHVRCFESFSSIMPYSIRAFLQATPLDLSWTADRSSVGKPDANDAIGRVLPLIEQGLASRRPYFMFMHQLLPHPPYKFLPDCTVRGTFNDSMGADSWDEDRKSLYIDNLKCANRRIDQLTELVAQGDPGAIVIVVGDHGSAFTVNWDRPLEEWTPSEIAERNGALSVARFPERCRSWLSPAINSVNLMRLAYACASGLKPSLLRNKSFITTYKAPYSHSLRLVSDRP
jgi:hypothetical protein